MSAPPIDAMLAAFPGLAALDPAARGGAASDMGTAAVLTRR